MVFADKGIRLINVDIPKRSLQELELLYGDARNPKAQWIWAGLLPKRRPALYRIIERTHQLWIAL